MATLFNTKISATYEGLLKTIDNAAITATLRELTDGSGNQSGLYLNTAGDFKVTAILEWGSLKDTGTGVTITQFVTAANGIENFDNDTTIPTSAAVKIYVDSKPGESLTQVLGFGNTTSGKDILVSAGDDITFTDTSKILMGASGDLEIYHDGSNSYIKDVGTGTLNLQGSTQVLISGANGEVGVQYVENAGVNLRHNNVQKLITTSSGAEVTGDLVVTGTITASGGSFLPLAGGTMTGNTTHLDNVRSLYGTSSDLQIYHDSSNSYIRDVGTGRLWIDSNGEGVSIISDGSGSSPIAHFYKDAAVELYYNNSKKFETTSAGATVTGALTTTTNVIVGANATFVDNGKAIFGASSDFEIFHNSTSNANIISSLLDRQLQITSNNLFIGNQTASENMITAIADGAVSLYYDNTKRIETVTTGAKVTGDLEVTGTITGAGGSFLPLIGGTMTGDTIHNDNVKSIYGTASDGLEVYHNGSNSFIKDSGTGLLVISTNQLQVYNAAISEFMITAVEDGSVNLYFDGSEKLATTNTGISVTGNVVPTGNLSLADNSQVQFGVSNDAYMYHSGSSFILRNNTGNLNFNQASVTDSIVFRTSDANSLDVTALTINRGGDLITGRDVTIAGDLTVNGTTTTVNTETLSVQDPLIELAKDNAANSLDIGFYGKYNDGTPRYLGLFNDASDSNKFKLFKGTTVEPTTTVNIGAAGYVAADLVVAGLEATDITIDDYIIHAGDSNTYFGFNGADDFRIYAGNTLKMIANADNVRLYYNGAQKFETTSTGISVTGGATFTGNVFLPDNKYATFGGANNAWELQIGVVGDNAFIEKTATTNGDLYIKNNGSSKGIIFQNGGSTALTIDSSQNATFTGDVQAQGIYVGATNLSFDFYNQGTSYFNGTVTVDAAFTQTGGDASTFSGNATFAGNVTLTGAGDKILDIYRDGGSGHSIRLHSEGASWIDNNNNF
jgi:hypothetical protein